jgi:RNA polymerase sigma-70 factor, ECF subfamily
MPAIAEKYSSTIDEAVVRLISRAANARGLSAADVRERIATAAGKYLFRGDASVEKKEVNTFIDEMRADELCLIVACERGDEKAWEDLVAGFDSTVRSAARKITANVEDAEDLASSIWAELYGLRRDAEGKKKSKLAYYSGRGSLAGWLRAVVSQLAVDEFRKQSKFVQVEETREFENLAEESSSNGGNPLVSHAENPEEIFSERQAGQDVSQALRNAIDSLDDEDRLVLKLYYFDDLKLKDIAATFGYHEATASRKVARLHADIRKAVEKTLRERHGWSESEVKRHLAQAASKLGMSVEKLFAVLMLFTLVQELILQYVQ